MLEQGKISAQMLRSATKQKLSLSSVAQTPPQTKFFINHVASIVEDFKENYTGKTNIRGGTLTIKSTLDPVAQAVAEKSVVRPLSTTNIGGGPDQGALLAIRRDGSVLAMVGGRDFVRMSLTKPPNRSDRPARPSKSLYTSMRLNEA